MRVPLKTFGIGALALLLGSTAAMAATTQNLNMRAFIGSASEGTPGITVSDNQITGPTNLSVRWEGDAIVVPTGYDLVGVDWVLTVSGTSDYRLQNVSAEPVTAEVERTRIRFAPTSCCPESFIGLPDGVTQTTQFLNYDDDFEVPGGSASEPGTVLIGMRSFNFDRGGSFADPGNLQDWLDSPTPTLRGQLTSQLGWFQPDDVQAINLTQGTMTLDVVARFEESSVGVIPLPAAGWLLLSGIFGLGGLGWMRRRAA